MEPKLTPDEYAELKNQAEAWKKVWEAMWNNGIAAYFHCLDGTGVERAVGFIEKLKKENDRLKKEIRKLKGN